MTAVQRFTRERPCPICGGWDEQRRGKGERCYGYLDSTGDYARCTREEHAGDLSINDDGTFSHRLAGSCRCGVEHGPADERHDETIRHVIRDRDGSPLAVHARKGSGSGKRVWWEGPDGSTGLNGTRPADMLYGLERLADLPESEPFLLAEGEPAADALVRLGYPALGTVTGAGKETAPHAISATVAHAATGRIVLLFPDADTPGRAHMGACAAVFAAAGALPLVLDWPEAPDKGDAVDLVGRLGADGARARLSEMIAAAEPWAAPTEPEAEQRAEQTLRIVQAHEFAAVEEPGAEAVLGAPDENVLPADGRMVFYGDGGAGKTTLEVDCALHLATGTDWLGLPVPKRARVLLIENEGSRRAFRRKIRTRLSAWDGESPDGWLYVLDAPWSKFSLTDPRVVDLLVERVVALGIDVICAGPLVEIGAAGTGSPDEVGAFGALVDAVCERVERPLAFLLVHHENRAGNISGAWERWPATLVHVTERGHGATGVFWRKVRHSSELQGRRWKLKWADGQSFELDETPEVTDEDIRAGILDAVEANPGCSLRTLETYWKEHDPPLPRDRSRAMLDELIDEGAVVNRGGGKGGEGGGGFKLYLADEESVRDASAHAPRTAPDLERAPSDASVRGARLYRARTRSPRTRTDDDQPDDNWCPRCQRVLVAGYRGQPRCHCADPDRGAS